MYVCMYVWEERGKREKSGKVNVNSNSNFVTWQELFLIKKTVKQKESDRDDIKDLEYLKYRPIIWHW